MDLVDIVSFVDLRYTVSKEETDVLDMFVDVLQFVNYVDQIFG